MKAKIIITLDTLDGDSLTKICDKLEKVLNKKDAYWELHGIYAREVVTKLEVGDLVYIPGDSGDWEGPYSVEGLMYGNSAFVYSILGQQYYYSQLLVPGLLNQGDVCTNQ